MIDTEPLRAFIRREFLFDRDAELPDDQELFPDLIDSLGVLDLVQFIEERYGVTIPDDELLAENFRSIAAIADFVAAKS